MRRGIARSESLGPAGLPRPPTSHHRATREPRPCGRRRSRPNCEVARAVGEANHAFARLVLGVVLTRTNRILQGIAECKRALALDRNLAHAHAQFGLAKLYMGCGAETEAHMREAFRLSPLDIFAHNWMLTVGFAKLQTQEDNEAVVWFHRSIEANRNFPLAYFGLAAALALHGSLDQARAAAQAGLLISSTFTIRRFRDCAQNDNPIYLAERERVYQGMRRAGVPEG